MEGALWGASSMGTLEDMLRKSPDTGISLHRGPVGEPGGDSLAGTFVREKESICGFLPWTQRTLRF
jgi:hypothetical protein